MLDACWLSQSNKSSCSCDFHVSNAVHLLPFWPEWFKVEHTDPMHPAATVNTADHSGKVERVGINNGNINDSMGLRFFLNGIVFHFNK